MLATQEFNGMPQRDQVFISYSHEDAQWLKQLERTLAPLTRTGRLRVWADSELRAGDRWRERIQAALDSTSVAVLLVSPAFLESEFIASNELPPLLQGAREDGLTIIWIAISASLYTHTPIAEYQAANDPKRPLDSLGPAEVNQVLVNIAEKINKAAARTSVRTASSLHPIPTPEAEATDVPGSDQAREIPRAAESATEQPSRKRITFGVVAAALVLAASVVAGFLIAPHEPVVVDPGPHKPSSDPGPPVDVPSTEPPAQKQDHKQEPPTESVAKDSPRDPPTAEETAKATKLYERANVALTQGKKQEAVGLYGQAIELVPGFVTAYEQRCLVLYQLQRSSEALDDCNKTVELAPKRARAHWVLGYVLRSVGNSQEGKAAFSKAIELQPDYADAYLARGKAWYDEEIYDQAIIDLTEALAHQSPNPRASAYLAFALYNNRRYSDAVKHATDAIASGETASDGYNVRGIAYFRLDKKQQAIADLQKAIELGSETARGNLDKILHPENHRSTPESITLIQSDSYDSSMIVRP